jgi:hypothetical protein
MYMENSNSHLYREEGFLEHCHQITAATGMFPVDPIEAIDIDEEEDFSLAVAVERAYLRTAAASRARVASPPGKWPWPPSRGFLRNIGWWWVWCIGTATCRSPEG